MEDRIRMKLYSETLLWVKITGSNDLNHFRREESKHSQNLLCAILSQTYFHIKALHVIGVSPKENLSVHLLYSFIFVLQNVAAFFFLLAKNLIAQKKPLHKKSPSRFWNSYLSTFANMTIQLDLYLTHITIGCFSIKKNNK